MPKLRVPRRLLTKKMVAWQKEYKDNRKIAKATGLASFGFGDIIRQSLFRMKNLLDQVPRDRTKELAQQPEPETGEEEQE